MTQAVMYLFDDATARKWQPFVLTRPAGELLFGAFTFRERAERRWGRRCAGHIAAPHLLGFQEPGAAPVVEPGSIGTDRPRLFVSSRLVPSLRSNALADASSPATLRLGRDVVGCYLPAGEATPDAAWFDAPTSLAGATDFPVEGQLLADAWDLVAGNAGRITQDFDETPGDASDPAPAATIGYRSGLFRAAADATIEPGVVLDFSGGPIWLAEGVTIRAFTRLTGPAWIGPGSTLLGGPFQAVSIGPVCKVHGEMEESVVLGYSNKAHDGFLGHAYLGRWVNLGAMTTNSDLKNNYGRIRLWTPDGDRDTGLIKMGSLLGDFVKTGIGSLLNTGTVIGAGSNLYGTEMPPKYVPPFSWGSGSELVAFDVEKFLQVTETVMNRRSLELGEGMRQVLRRAWRIGRGEA